jgi:hypothetical protein
VNNCSLLFAFLFFALLIPVNNCSLLCHALLYRTMHCGRKRGKTQVSVQEYEIRGIDEEPLSPTR